jgi:hypothetical protein
MDWFNRSWLMASFCGGLLVNLRHMSTSPDQNDLVCNIPMGGSHA